MHTVFALLCFVVVIHWLIFQYPSGLLHWHCGNLTIAPVPAKQTWWIWINTSCEFIMDDCITTAKQNTTKPCAYFLRYTVSHIMGFLWYSLHDKMAQEAQYKWPVCGLPLTVPIILAQCASFVAHSHKFYDLVLNGTDIIAKLCPFMEKRMIIQTSRCT